MVRTNLRALFNPSKNDIKLIRLVPRSEHSPSWLQKTDQLMLYREMNAVCSEIRTNT
jgi:hypothetical protein